jgi:uncharacterized protein YjbI with pentapeptide repeats
MASREADIEANLREANVSKAGLSKANLSDANLSKANLRAADLTCATLLKANLSGADLNGATLIAAYLFDADLRKADLSGADLGGAQLGNARLREANFSKAHLHGASLVNTDLRGADLTGCHIHGVSAWRVKPDGDTKQQNLIITPENEPEITVDNIEVAQFVYLLLHNEKIRDVIDTITSKAVLILGRFTDDRKVVLDAMRDNLRERGYLPILFDFEGPLNRNTDETVTLLARMARFVIADISDAKSVLQELRTIVPNLPTLPVQPKARMPAFVSGLAPSLTMRSEPTISAAIDRISASRACCEVTAQTKRKARGNAPTKKACMTSARSMRN